MSTKPAASPPGKAPAGRNERLKQALKANIARRKDQARMRQAQARAESGKNGD